LPSGSDAAPTRVAFVLPPREVFTPDSAGAISRVVSRLAGATPGAVVIGRPIPKTTDLGRNRDAHSAEPAFEQTFANIRYEPAGNTTNLIRTLRRLNPDYIDIHQQPRLALALSYLLPGAKSMLFLHNDPLTMRGLKTRVSRSLMLRRLHRIVCVSKYLQSRYMTGLTGPGPTILPNPLTLSELPPPAAERERNILFVGRIVHDKGPDLFVNAFCLARRKLPGWTATMMGGDRFGPRSPETQYVARLRGAAAKAGITFTGPRPHADILAAMASAAIVVIPSRWPEPFGLVALEAAASGAVVITSGQGGLPEAAGPGALHIDIASDDVSGLAAAMIAIVQHEKSWSELTEAGLEHARKFDTPVIAAALENLRASG